MDTMTTAEELVEAMRAATASPVREYVAIWVHISAYNYGQEKRYFAARYRAYDVRDAMQAWLLRHNPRALLPPQPPTPGIKSRDSWDKLLRIVPYEAYQHDLISPNGEEYPWKEEREVL